MGGKTRSLGQAILFFKGDATDLNKKLSKVTKSIGEGMKKVGKLATVIGGAITGVMALAVKQSAALSVEMSKLATLGVENLDAMRQSAHDVATEFGLNATDAVEQFYQLLSAGLPEETAFTVLRENAKGAVAGVGELSSAVNLGTSAMSAYGLKAGTVAEVTANMERVMGLAATAVKQGKTTFDEMSQGIGRTIDAAAAVGITLEEVFATIARGTASGKKASEVWTSLNAAITNINKPSKEAAELAKALGIKFDTAALKAKGWAKFLLEVRAAVEGKNKALFASKVAIEKEIIALEQRNKLSAKEKARLKDLKDQLKGLAGVGEDVASTMGKLFGSAEAFNLVLAITKDEGAEFVPILDDMANAQQNLNEMFQAGIENDPTFVFRQFKAELAELSDTVGLILIPELQKLLEKYIKPTVEKIKEWMEKNPELTESIVKWTAVIGALMLVLGPLLIILGSLVTSIVGAAAAFGIIGAPVLIVIAALAALAAAIAAVILFWGKLKEPVKKAWDAIKKKTTETWKNLKSAFDNGMAILKVAWDDFWASDMGQALQGSLDFIVGAVATAMGDIDSEIAQGFAKTHPKWVAWWDKFRFEFDIFIGGLKLEWRRWFEWFVRQILDVLTVLDLIPGVNFGAGAFNQLRRILEDVQRIIGAGSAPRPPGSVIGASLPGGAGSPAPITSASMPGETTVNVEMIIQGNIVGDEGFARQLAEQISVIAWEGGT